MKKLILILFSVALSVNCLAGLSLKDLNPLDRSDKCKSDDEKCKQREHLKGAAAVAAVAVAAKLLADMVIEYKIQQVTGEDEVISQYKKVHKTLPNEAIASFYDAKPAQGDVVEPGSDVRIQSKIEVVPGKDKKTTQIEERLTIFDNEDHSKVLKTLTKPVNEKTQRAGRFENQFSFVMPKGMPQGIYPVKSTLLVNQKESDVSDNRLQLVLFVDELGNGEIVALNN